MVAMHSAEKQIHARRDLEIEAVGLDDKLPVGCKEASIKDGCLPTRHLSEWPK